MLSTKTIVIAGAGIATAAGLALLGASFAGADQTSATATAYGYGRTAPSTGEGGQSGERPGGTANGNTDPSKPIRSDEQLLTGETADKVTAAAKAKEPDATIERVETDSDGVYDAHMVRADGTHITVQVGAAFQVTNVIEGHAGGKGGAGQGAPGKDGQQPPAGGTSNGEAPSASGSASSS
ncbi:MAG: hypothetical protein ABJA74_04005 [Lapillicoccus sp.]